MGYIRRVSPARHVGRWVLVVGRSRGMARRDLSVGTAGFPIADRLPGCLWMFCGGGDRIEILQEISTCTNMYLINRCEPSTRIPAM